MSKHRPTKAAGGGKDLAASPSRPATALPAPKVKTVDLNALAETKGKSEAVTTEAQKAVLLATITETAKTERLRLRTRADTTVRITIGAMVVVCVLAAMYLPLPKQIGVPQWAPAAGLGIGALVLWSAFADRIKAVIEKFTGKK